MVSDFQYLAHFFMKIWLFAILPLPLIEEKQLSVNGQRIRGEGGGGGGGDILVFVLIYILVFRDQQKSALSAL